jgi:hypothetical protein
MAREIAQWQSDCLAWVLSLAPQKKGNREKGKGLKRLLKPTAILPIYSQLSRGRKIKSSLSSWAT